MLKAMRQHAKYFYVLFVVVILSFIFWGTGGVDQNSGTQAVAQVGEEAITSQEYWRAYDSMADLYRDIYKDEFDAEAMDLKNTVLNTLVEERLLLIAAVEAGFKVTDKELQDSIVNNPTFMRDGAFNKDVYLRTLQLNRMTPTYYEAVKRRELMLTKMRLIIEETVDLSPSELDVLSSGEEAYTALRETLLESKKNAAVKSFIEGVKKRVPVTVNEQLIS
jgi:peptidyl-prolyl cis-trans isomerase D